MTYKEPTLDQMVEALRIKYSIDSSGDAKSILSLIAFYDRYKNIGTSSNNAAVPIKLT